MTENHEKVDTASIIKDLPKAVLNWYSFTGEERTLYIGQEQDAVARFLAENCAELFCYEADYLQSSKDLAKNLVREGFDLVVAVGVLERQMQPTEHLKLWKELLHPQGKMLIAADNRLGIRYFCGDRDPFTNRNFDGVENYRRALDVVQKEQAGRCYSKAELKQFFEAVGLESHKFYSIFPNLDMPQLIYADNHYPNEEISIRYFPRYNHPSTIFLEEEFLLKDLIANGMFHSMANAFFIEIVPNGDFAPVVSVTTSMDRGPEKAIATIIRNDKTVEKRMLYPQGIQRLKRLAHNCEELSAAGMNVVKGRLENRSYFMPFIEGESYHAHLKKLFRTDREAFIRAMDGFRELILNSSNHVRIDEKLGVILKKGYIDLVPHNCIFNERGIHIFDQEEYVENCPANAIITRSVQLMYEGDLQMTATLPIQFFYERYNLEEGLEQYNTVVWEFLNDLRNIVDLLPFLHTVERNPNLTNSNRQRLNYSAGEYQRIFIDVFRDIGSQRLVLFGSGNFTKRFLELYKKDYNIECIVDNNSARWGEQLEGYPIVSPKELRNYSSGGYRIIVCIKNFLGVIQQLEEMGLKNYCIYDPNISYDRKPPITIAKGDQPVKKYNIGYVAGVFDLFHIGHLNLLRRAKMQCNRLIVGVVSDEGVREFKKTEPYVPFNERLEIVAGCRYVDEAVEIPLNLRGSEEAYNLYRFDVQFSGSDYVKDVGWLSQKAYLEAQGAQLVFLPYTESTSSTKLKGAIDKRSSQQDEGGE